MNAQKSVILLRSILLMPALIAADTGCGSHDTPASTASEVDEPNWSAGEEWRLSDAPVLIIGAADGPDAIGRVGQLTGESGVALLSDGRIAVADGQANEIRIYDAAGVRLATAGRTGQGPGEFRNLAGIATFAGDSLLAWGTFGPYVDRLAVFSPAGEFVRVFPPLTMRIRDIYGPATDGAILIESTESQPGWEAPATGEYREPILYRRFSLSGDSLGTFGPVPGPERAAVTARQRALVYYGRETHVVMGRRFIYSGDDGTFEIGVHDPATGALLRHLRRPYELVAVTPEEHTARVEMMKRMDARMDSLNPRAAAALRELRPDPGAVPARDSHPAFGRIVEDPDENVWVRHTVPSSDSVQTWSVFEREGAWLGEINLPREMSVEAIGRDAIAVVVTDEFRIEYVHIYRVLKP